MPYNCDDCGKEGARMNTILEIRLCEECKGSFKYKTICKSEVIKTYKLTKTDLQNYAYEEFLCRNPMYRSASPMNLYYEKEVQRYFIEKHNDIITNKLNINIESEPVDKIISKVFNYLEKIKNTKKESKIQKILNKFSVELEDLPEYVQDELKEANSPAEFERILNSFYRRKELYKFLKLNGFSQYIDLDICKDYVNTTNNYTKEQLIGLINMMLEKKKLIKQKLVSYPKIKQKYNSDIVNFINLINTSVDDVEIFIKKLIDSETRLTELTEGLKAHGLELRSDSVLCNSYLNGYSLYSLEYVIKTMVEMNWFFSYTNYSECTRQYDRMKRQSRYDYDYNYDYNYNSRYNSRYSEDSESDNEYKHKQKDSYNELKSNYAKREAMKQWIQDGSKGIKPPETLNWLIEEIEEGI